MAFYIKPPDGYGSLEELRVYALRRISFLGDVLSCAEAADFRKLLEAGSSAIDSECLIEGSRKDRISHFLLRLICSQHAEISAFFIRAETELFCHRFSCMNADELTHLLASTHRFLSRLQRKGHLGVCTSTTDRENKSHQQEPTSPDMMSSTGSSMSPGKDKVRRARPFVPSAVQRSRMAYNQALINLLDVLARILQASGSWKRTVECYMEYSQEVFGIRFQHALCPVATRRVLLDQGIAWVKFADLHIVLAAMFEDIMREGVRMANLVPCHFLEDDRLVNITRGAVALFYRTQSNLTRTVGRAKGRGKTIQAWEVDGLSQFFPPCMSHLHRTLRRKHRLRHFSRVQYTLFLKDIGLPVTDAINFWKAEYSKPSSGCHDNSAGGGGGGCQHSWAKDERRYTYNIRHLYGLEGSRTDYKSHSCRSLQEMQPGFGEEGGCPFRHFDDRSLQTMLDIEDIVGPKRKEILQAKEKKKYWAACRTYFGARYTALCGGGCCGESSISVGKGSVYLTVPSSVCNEMPSVSDSVNKAKTDLGSPSVTKDMPQKASSCKSISKDSISVHGAGVPSVASTLMTSSHKSISKANDHLSFPSSIGGDELSSFHDEAKGTLKRISSRADDDSEVKVQRLDLDTKLFTSGFCRRDTTISLCSCQTCTKKSCESTLKVEDTLVRVCTTPDNDSEVKVQRLDLGNKLETSEQCSTDRGCATCSCSCLTLHKSCECRLLVVRPIKGACAIADSDVKFQRLDLNEEQVSRHINGGSMPLVNMDKSVCRTSASTKSANVNSTYYMMKEGAKITNENKLSLIKEGTNTACMSIKSDTNSSATFANIESGNPVQSKITNECAESPNNICKSDNSSKKNLDVETCNSAPSKFTGECPISQSSPKTNHTQGIQRAMADLLEARISKPVDFYHSFAKLFDGKSKSEPDVNSCSL